MKLWSSSATGVRRVSRSFSTVLTAAVFSFAAVIFCLAALQLFSEAMAYADVVVPTPPPPGNVVAANAAGAMPSPFHFILGTVNFFLIAFFVYYILVLRPAQLKQEEQLRFVKGLKSGDPVVTSGGILGRASAISPEFVTVEVAPGMKLRVLPEHVFGPDGKPAAAGPRALEKDKGEKEKKAK